MGSSPGVSPDKEVNHIWGLDYHLCSWRGRIWNFACHMTTRWSSVEVDIGGRKERCCHKGNLHDPKMQGSVNSRRCESAGLFISICPAGPIQPAIDGRVQGDQDARPIRSRSAAIKG